MKHLTLDVQVVMSGAGKGDFEHRDASFGLMETIANGSARVVVDDQGFIEQHYSEKLGSSEYGLYWMQRLADDGRVIVVPRADPPKRLRVALQKAKFPLANEDFKYYVRTALSNPGRCLVTHDPHYTEQVQTILRRHGNKLRVFSATNATEIVNCDCAVGQP